MRGDKGKFLLAIIFFAFTAFSIWGWITQGYTSYYLAGCIVGPIVGFGFLRSSRNG